MIKKVNYLTLEEKMENLKTASMEDARSQGNKIIQEYKDALEKVFNEHKEIALRQAELTLKSETEKARLQLNKAMAKSQIELKREQGKCQTELKNKLFQRVKVLVDDYMKTEAYTELLVKHINKAVDFAQNETMTIYINPSDEGLKEILEQKTNASLTVSKEDFTGGIRAVIPARHILIDNSFRSSLQQEYDNFLFLGGNCND